MLKQGNPIVGAEIWLKGKEHYYKVIEVRDWEFACDSYTPDGKRYAGPHTWNVDQFLEPNESVKLAPKSYYLKRYAEAIKKQ